MLLRAYNYCLYLIVPLFKILDSETGRMFLCPKLSAFAPKCVFYSPLIVCICPKSCESSPNQAFHTPNIKKKKFGEKTHDLKTCRKHVLFSLRTIPFNNNKIKYN